MCGRFALFAEAELPEALKERFAAQPDPDAKINKRYNAAPSQFMPVVVDDAGQRSIAMKRWGLLPKWAKDEAMGNKLINARGESVHEKPSFRSAFKRKRCIVPASGFYEWQKTPEGKQPVFITNPDGGMLAFAGLHERWTQPNGEELYTFTIITTSPNSVMEPIHNRMPVILGANGSGIDAEAAWLSGESDPDSLHELLAPCPDAWLMAYAVSKQVNSPKNDVPDCIEPLKETGDLF